MVEQYNNDVVCGVIFENGEYAPVFCNEKTGECYFPDPIMSYDRLISELSVDAPVEVEVDELALAVSGGVYGVCIGIIHDGESLLKLLSDVEAVRVPAETPDAPAIETYDISIYTDYEEDEE